MFDVQLWAYVPGTATATVLPQPLNWQASMVLSDVGSMSLTYPIASPGHEVLDGYCDVEVRFRSGDTWVCPPQGRFSLMDVDVDPVGEADRPTRTYTLVSYGWLLAHVLQMVTTGLDDQGERDFGAHGVGEVVGTLIAEGIAAGTTPDLTYLNSVGTGGSTPHYAPGKSVLDILTEARDQGMCEWLMQPDTAGQGRKLVTYLNVGSDLSTGADPVAVRWASSGGVDAAPSKVSRRDLSAGVLVAGDQQSYLALTNPGADVPYGVLRSYVTAGGVTDAGALTVIAQAALDKGAAPRAQHTRSVRFEGNGSAPLADYNLADTILAPDETGTLAAMRVLQITLTFDDRTGLSGNLVLGDRFATWQTMMDRQVRKLTSAARISGSGRLPVVEDPWVTDQKDQATDPTPPGAPAAPTAVTRLGTVTLTWTAGTLPDNYYNTEIHVGTTSGFTPSSSTLVGYFVGSGIFVLTSLPYNTTRYVRLVTVTKSGARSTPSAQVAVSTTPAVDTDFIGQIISGTNIVNGSITASDKIVSNTITGGLIQALAIASGHIQSNAITTDKINAGAVTAVKADITSLRTSILSANSITTGMISVGAVSGAQIANGGVGTSQIAGSAVGGTQIADGAITTSKITADWIVGKWFRTSASGSRLEFTDTYFRMYSGGTPVVSFTANGDWSMATSTSNAKVYISPDGLQLFNTSGTRTVYLNGNTGDASFTGTVSASAFVGGSFSGSISNGGTVSGGTYSSPYAPGITGYTGGTLYASSGPLSSSSAAAHVEVYGPTLGFYSNSGYSGYIGGTSANTISMGATVFISGNLNVASVGSGAYAYVTWNSANNRFYYTTSSLRSKADVRDLTGARTVLALRPVTYVDREGTDQRRMAGFIAEEVAAAGLDTLVVRDAQGRPSSLNYGQFTAYHNSILAEHDARLAALEARLVAA